jgi:hypothetical protein
MDGLLGSHSTLRKDMSLCLETHGFRKAIGSFWIVVATMMVVTTYVITLKIALLSQGHKLSQEKGREEK